ncbi:MAG: thiamine-phosphate kinase [Fuerstiella sp.]
MSSEREFIRQLQNRFQNRFPVTVGIGDDGAVIDVERETEQVIVTDLLLDGVHFDLANTSPEMAGRKAVAVNLSDLAAMACRPTAAFVSIAIPHNLSETETFLNRLYDGMEDLARQYEFTIAGGDTNRWNGPFAINVCLTGIPFAKTAMLRSSARPGDSLFVTGPLGGSLPSGRHLSFEPRLNAANWLATNTNIHAMMDISDGLSIDLNRMMEASGTGAIITAANIPIHSDVSLSLPARTRLDHALNDGEDFELLIAAPNFPEVTPFPEDITIIKIGEVTHDRGQCQIRSSDGKIEVLPEKGWQHL